MTTTDTQAIVNAISFSQSNGVTVPHLDQYFGLWLIEPNRFSQFVTQAKRMDLVAHIQQAEPSTIEMRSGEGFGGPRSSDDIAFFSISGPMMKFASSLSDSTGTVSLRRQIRAAARDETIRAAVIRIDSPGGTFAGQGDLIREIENFKAQKPLWTFAEDIAASAGYWAFACGDQCWATPETALGSIGTFSALYDESGAYEADGIKVHTFTTGALKGQGIPGSKPSEEYLAYRQEMVEQANEFFLAGVSADRGMSREKVLEIATGGMFFASEAKKHGMVDEIGTYDEMMTALRASLGSSSQGNLRTRCEDTSPPCDTLQNSGEEVATETTEELNEGSMSAASLSELKQAIPKASAEFLVDALSKELSIESAKEAWYQKVESDNASLIEKSDAEKQSLAEQLDTLRQENETLKSAAAKRPGVTQGVSSGSESTASAVDQINQMVADRMKTTGETRGAAWSKVCRSNPELRQQMVAEANS